MVELRQQLQKQTISRLSNYTLLPWMLWNFFSRHFLTLEASLNVMKMNPLLFLVLWSVGSSAVSIWRESLELDFRVVYSRSVTKEHCAKGNFESSPSFQKKCTTTPTSPNVSKYSLIVSSVASGFRPPTKIFTGSFFIAIAFLGSIERPSSLCSFCSRTWKPKTRRPKCMTWGAGQKHAQHIPIHKCHFC